MKLGFDFELSETRRRSENYVRPAYDPYPIPKNENTIPKNENPIHKNEKNPIPKNENPIPKNENPIHNYDIETIESEWAAITSMLKVAFICEDMARKHRNAGEHALEDCYLTEAEHAYETAYMLYILTHK